MLVMIQNELSIVNVNTINVDLENPQLDSKDQKYVLVGFTTLESNSAILLGIYDNKSLAKEALLDVYKQLKVKQIAKVR